MIKSPQQNELGKSDYGAIIFQEGDFYLAEDYNGRTIKESTTDAGPVLQAAIDELTWGGLIFVKHATYPVLSNIEVKYSNVILVLKGVTLQVPDQSVVCLLGANGAGKTTTLRAVSGMLKPQDGKVTRGSIEFDGKTIENMNPEIIGGMGLTQVMEGRRILEHLTVEENLKVGGYMLKKHRTLKENTEKIYGHFPAIEKRRFQVCGYLSGGEQQMLVIGRALMINPIMMLLDEPSLGLAPLVTSEIYNILGTINEVEKTAMLIVEQNANTALSMAEYGYIMESGRVVMDATSEKLKENEDVKEFYLGLSMAGQKKSYKDIKHYKRRKRWLG